MTLREQPVFIRSGENDLFGVLTSPAEANGAAVILLFGGLYTLSINRNRVSVEAARRLSSLGYHVLRMDLHGVGESTGTVEIYDLARPFFEDVLSAAAWLRDRGIRDILLVGQCYGARTCLAASEHLSDLRGVALFSMPVLNFDRTVFEARRNARVPLRALLRRALKPRIVRGLFSQKRRQRYTAIAKKKLRTMRGLGEADTRALVSPDVVRQLQRLTENQTPVLMVYGVEDFRDDFESVRASHIDHLIARSDGRIDLRMVDDIKMHGLPSLESQARAIALVEGWLSSPAKTLGQGHQAAARS